MQKRNKQGAKWLDRDIDNLFKAILKLRTIQEAQKFFRDLLTVQEIKTFAMRWKVAQMLEQGHTYQKIEKQTGMSSTTIARINRWLEYGEGGYRLILKRMKRSQR
jgi:TrpR-related protein YerC/YecD